jgi:ribose 5-phosphate isomerase A
MNGGTILEVRIRSKPTMAGQTIEEHALGMIADGQVVGLGTGRAATAFIHALGERVRAGLRIRGVATSRVSEDLAGQLGIPTTTLDEVDGIDVDFDGADEVAPNCDVIKGYGGALVREKIVAASARRLVILVGPEKLVPSLGGHGRLPVEIVPFGMPLCRRRLEKLGWPGQPRMKDGNLFVTDNGNYILDCIVPMLDQPRKTEQMLLDIPGVVGTGLFLGMADTVLIQQPGGVEVRRRSQS